MVEAHAVNYIEANLATNPTEKRLQQAERELGLSKVSYITYRDAIKRYGYNDIPFTHHILTYIGPKINIKGEDFDKEEGEDQFKQVCLTFKSDYLFHEGAYDVRKLIVLGFTLCKHATPNEQREELWALINPEMKPTVSKKDVEEFFEMLFYLALQLPYDIELEKKKVN
eukprot:CAMPEP_0202957524 /NCGR_PEP_ID=MMETSP1396-20130829/1891_1 /ASSEMBLY_ACC=CAM_ASM_000872 /TAXON_ID= /ORGANISM="Pseudokeronopsis sp., Strain Brazil" /LENGTH=168 /DNA_ID=CAMNT_0049675035 /DNA_START=45 /DNA_END=551 /DNA_ORIENTATION=+